MSEARYEPSYDKHGNVMVCEDYLAYFLPDGWSYDCWWDNRPVEEGGLPSHFTIYAPGESEPYRLAFQSLDTDGCTVWADDHA
jgi:hypothetical protein